MHDGSELFSKLRIYTADYDCAKFCGWERGLQAAVSGSLPRTLAGETASRTIEQGVARAAARRDRWRMCPSIRTTRRVKIDVYLCESVDKEEKNFQSKSAVTGPAGQIGYCFVSNASGASST